MNVYIREQTSVIVLLLSSQAVRTQLCIKAVIIEVHKFSNKYFGQSYIEFEAFSCFIISNYGFNTTEPVYFYRLKIK